MCHEPFIATEALSSLSLIPNSCVDHRNSKYNSQQSIQRPIKSSTVRRISRRGGAFGKENPTQSDRLINRPRKHRQRCIEVHAMRVYCVSDLHTDYQLNTEVCANLSDTEYKSDVVIIAGDISDDLQVIKQTLQQFLSKWAHVFFVPGNHELWMRRSDAHLRDSLDKWDSMKKMCEELGVIVKPKQIEGVWICPILSWYHASWDTEPEIQGSTAIEKVMVDYHSCRWPSGLKNGCDQLAQRFDSLNEPALSNLSANLELDEDETGERPPLITFSHFLPLQALLPEKRMLFQPNLAKAVGSNYLARRIEELQPLAHVFGHTHFLWDSTIRNVRYVQWCLGTPKEQKRRKSEWRPFLLYDTDSGLSEPVSCYWSSYYTKNKRDLSNTTPASWSRVPHEHDNGD